jgi:hypothetical protein
MADRERMSLWVKTKILKLKSIELT